MEFELSFGFGMVKSMIKPKIESRAKKLLEGLQHKITTGEDASRSS
jgi:hypothetical protein